MTIISLLTRSSSVLCGTAGSAINLHSYTENIPLSIIQLHSSSPFIARHFYLPNSAPFLSCHHRSRPLLANHRVAPLRLLRMQRTASNFALDRWMIGGRVLRNESIHRGRKRHLRGLRHSCMIGHWSLWRDGRTWTFEGLRSVRRSSMKGWIRRVTG